MRFAEGARTNPLHRGRNVARLEGKPSASFGCSCNQLVTLYLQNRDDRQVRRGAAFCSHEVGRSGAKVGTSRRRLRDGPVCQGVKFGGRQEDRTPDLCIANAALSQLS